MARDDQYRMLWSSISNSKKIRQTPGDKWFRIGCHLVYTWLIPWTDDDGRLRGDPLWVIANIFPNEGFTTTEIESFLTELHRIGLIEWYEVDGERFIQIIDNENHQHIRKDRYKPSTYPSADNGQPVVNHLSTNAPQSAYLKPSPSPSPTPEHSRKRKRAATAHPLFDLFWKAYPKKKSRVRAEEVFTGLKPDEHLLAEMIHAIELAKTSDEWIEKNGKYIPHPATWLNQRRWEDEGVKLEVKPSW